MYVLDKGTRFVIPRTEMTYPGHNMKLHIDGRRRGQGAGRSRDGGLRGRVPV